MADRYWVGGTATWDSTAGTKWATTSGGEGGASAPTSTDAVYFDANSGSGSIDCTYTQALCASLTCTGFTGTLSSNLTTYGDVVLGSGMTASSLAIYCSTNTCNITTNGKSISAIGVLSGSAVLQDNTTCNYIYGYAGTFNANNKNVAASSVDVSSGATITPGSGTWTITGSGAVWTVDPGATVSASTSTIKLSGSSNQTFAGGGKTYNNIWHDTAGYDLTITGANTFNDLKVSSQPCSIKFTAGTTTTITTFTEVASGSVLTLTSVTGATHTISCASGTIELTNANISYSTASGGATFQARSSTDGGNNSGWVFIRDNALFMSEF